MVGDIVTHSYSKSFLHVETTSYCNGKIISIRLSFLTVLIELCNYTINKHKWVDTSTFCGNHLHALITF